MTYSKNKYSYIVILLFILILISSCTSKSIREDPPYTWKYFIIYAGAEDDQIFVWLQDDLGINPKMSKYNITVNLDNKNNQYVMIGVEQDPSARTYPWSKLRKSVQNGLIKWDGSNKERLK